jgi:hypothetical protein
MDASLVLGLFVALAVAAARWGHDSREGVRSKEQDLAAHGVCWEGLGDAASGVGAGVGVETRKPRSSVTSPPRGRFGRARLVW